VDFAKTKAESNKPAAISLGLLTLTIQYTMGATHTWGGINYADAFNASMAGIGIGLLFLGTALFIPWTAVHPIVLNGTNQVEDSFSI